MTSLRDLFADASPERLAAIEAALVIDEKTHTPWYIQALIVVGAWLASIFFLLFVFLVVGWTIFGDSHRELVGVIGTILLIATVAGRRMVTGLFFAQCCLAFSLAAQAMILFGFVLDGIELGSATLIVSSLAVALYFLYPDFLHRTVTTLAALQLTYWWFTTSSYFDGGEPSLLVPDSRFGTLDLYYLAHLAGLLWCFLPVDRHEARRPFGYALLASLVVMEAQPVFYLWFIENSQSIPTGAKVLHPWYIEIVPVFIVAAFLFVSVWVAGGRSMLAPYRQRWLVLAALLGSLLFLQLSPVLLALLIMLLGLSLQNRLFLGMGIILFAFFLSHYYYSLQFDLMEKAGVMILSGGLLLLLRGSLSRVLPKETA